MPEANKDDGSVRINGFDALQFLWCVRNAVSVLKKRNQINENNLLAMIALIFVQVKFF